VSIDSDKLWCARRHLGFIAPGYHVSVGVPQAGDGFVDSVAQAQADCWVGQLTVPGHGAVALDLFRPAPAVLILC
jgi:hypothetical protein